MGRRKNNDDLLIIGLTFGAMVSIELLYRLGIQRGIEKASLSDDLPAPEGGDGNDDSVEE